MLSVATQLGPGEYSGAGTVDLEVEQKEPVGGEESPSVPFTLSIGGVSNSDTVIRCEADDDVSFLTAGDDTAVTLANLRVEDCQDAVAVVGDSVLEIVNVTFDGLGREFGGSFVSCRSGTPNNVPLLEVANAVFTNSSANSGVAISADGCEVTVTDSYFSHLRAYDTGGALFLSDSSTELERVTFESVSADRVGVIEVSVRLWRARARVCVCV